MIKTSDIKMIEVSDWDRLVQETYGRTYSFQQQDGCKSRGVFKFRVPTDGYDYENDTIPEEINGEEMGVSFKAWLARDPKKWYGNESDPAYYIDLFWERNFYPAIEILANDLYDKGLLPAGEYAINIDW